MKKVEWLVNKIQEIEFAQKKATTILRDPEQANVHEMVVDALTDMVIAKAFLNSSVSMLYNEGRWDEELKAEGK
jgi:hypothetical protein